MAKVTFESMVPEILPSVPECTDLIIIRALRRATEEFLTKSMIWRADLDDHDITVGEADVELDLPSSDLRIVQLKKATIGTKDIPQIADDQQPPNGTQTFCSLTDFGKTLRLTPTPKVSATIALRAVLSTSSKSVGLEAAVESEIHEHLLDGALARLYTMAGMPWANNTLAGFHGSVFNAAIMDARGRAENNSGRAVRKITYGGY